MFTHRHSTLVAISLLAATIGLAGCGSTGGDATQSAGFAAFSGAQQVVVQTRPGAVLAARSHMRKVHSIPALYVDVISLDQDESVDDAIRQLKSDPGVVFAEPNHVMRALDDTQNGGDQAAPVTNDPLFSQQFGPQQIHAPQAWSKTRGAGVTIAIVDTGIDITH